MTWDIVQGIWTQWHKLTHNHLVLTANRRTIQAGKFQENGNTSPGSKPSSGSHVSSNVANEGAKTKFSAGTQSENNYGSMGHGLTVLKSSESGFRAISDASPLGIVVTDVEGHCTYTNAAYRTISGLTLKQALGMNWVRLIHPDDCQRVLGELRDITPGTVSFQTEFRFVRTDGSAVWTRVNIAALNDESDNGAEIHGYVLTIEDISTRKSTEFALRDSEAALFEEKERAQVTLNSIGDAVLVTDLMGNVTYINQVAEEMIGWSDEEAQGRPLSEVFNIIDGTTRQIADDPAQRAITEDRIIELATNCILVRRDGFESLIEDSAAPIHDRDGQVTGAVIVFHDLSQSRAMVSKMTHQARHDFLTGLPNRALLMERLSQALRLAQRHDKQVALLFVDLDDFKHINDSLGHGIGDQLLQTVADRLVTCVRATDTVCRQGGDEFVILLAEIERPEDASRVAEKLQAAFAVPQRIDGQEINLTLSIGISVYPDDGDNIDAVMHNADIAMYHAKESGRNNYRFFRPDMNALTTRPFANAKVPLLPKRG
ncbi:diguanylate cyclase domain-containing protein [Thiohalophilus thiocyanatoxydans]|uniref:PAS domain S-box-containing protein/diguanylate cyclase (GGDEF)-like protein n=1 Tax=Thiohalophilus thiocyanatoxydans TaxID=381308 RepID=A0A4R8IFM1_9GAMM|nr:diguanylate cyclase [Thiohalophilus thiocyanatoxydans]TDX99315.1 PAS domain S-box-containing protein/diguanylate cyclase (GGDEF)-like protein [Thiohalophilus thiocyanatoxydans]